MELGEDGGVTEGGRGGGQRETGEKGDGNQATLLGCPEEEEEEEEEEEAERGRERGGKEQRTQASIAALLFALPQSAASYLL